MGSARHPDSGAGGGLVGGDADDGRDGRAAGGPRRGTGLDLVRLRRRRARRGRPGSRLETLVSLSDDVDDAGKARALVLAADVHAVLERCGLPLDGHGVLASRSRFCRRDVSWEDGIERWAADPAADRGVVMIGLLADAWSVTEAARGERLRPLVIAAARRHAAARTAMLRDAASVRAGIPSRLRILATQDDRVDLEAAVIDPIVKIARWGALSAGSHALSTTDRPNHAAAGSVIDTDDASTLCDCYGRCRGSGGAAGRRHGWRAAPSTTRCRCRDSPRRNGPRSAPSPGRSAPSGASSPGAREAQRAGALALQVHHWAGGTEAFTSATCSPQPAQVVLWQRGHSTG